MKLAMLSFRLPRPGFKRGGVERVAHDLANALVRRGHEVTVWSADPLPPSAKYSVQALPFANLIHSWLGIRLVSGYLGNVLALLPRYGDVDALIAHGDSLLLPLRGIPLVRVMHGSAREEARTARSLARKVLQFGVWIQELITAGTQLTVGVSENTTQHNHFVNLIIPNGVDTTRFFPDPAAKSEKPSILFVGTMGGRKRGALLLDWFRVRIQTLIPNAELWMVSDPGLEYPGVCYFTGASDNQLAELYRSAWVYASPSVYEGFGLPYLEAMASGTPVVATANVGSREVTGEGLHAVLLENDDEFAPALMNLLERASLRDRWVERGLERAQDYSLERVGERYERVLIELLNRVRGHVRESARPTGELAG